MRMSRHSRFWMTGCMALVLLIAQQAPTRMQREADASRRSAIKLLSPYPMDETIRKIESAARTHGLPVLAIVEPQTTPADLPHSLMQPTQVLVLGDSSKTTPVVQTEADQMIELPLQVWVAERADGQTQVTVHDPANLAHSEGLPEDLMANLAALPTWMNAALI